jgi:hypothetical protein
MRVKLDYLTIIRNLLRSQAAPWQVPTVSHILVLTRERTGPPFCRLIKLQGTFVQSQTYTSPPKLKLTTCAQDSEISLEEKLE